MTKEEAIKLFQDKKVRVHWDPDKEKGYFSIIDVVAVLTENDFQTSRNYWKVLNHFGNASNLRAVHISKPRQVHEKDSHHCNEVTAKSSIRYHPKKWVINWFYMKYLPYNSPLRDK